jgi:hypothetical protein
MNDLEAPPVLKRPLPRRLPPYRDNQKHRASLQGEAVRDAGCSG